MQIRFPCSGSLHSCVRALCAVTLGGFLVLSAALEPLLGIHPCSPATDLVESLGLLRPDDCNLYNQFNCDARQPSPSVRTRIYPSKFRSSFRRKRSAPRNLRPYSSYSLGSRFYSHGFSALQPLHSCVPALRTVHSLWVFLVLCLGP